jgi:hypothetical protein
MRTAREIADHYANRWTIEPSFRDAKDLRFGMGMSALRIADPQRRDRLLQRQTLGMLQPRIHPVSLLLFRPIIRTGRHATRAECPLDEPAFCYQAAGGNLAVPVSGGSQAPAEQHVMILKDVAVRENAELRIGESTRQLGPSVPMVVGAIAISRAAVINAL